MGRVLSRIPVVAASGVLTAAAGFGLWTATPAAHATTNMAATIDICVAPAPQLEGDLCCDGKGVAVIANPEDPELVCVAADAVNLNL